uniref:Uncharacterized protein n=1 Tax=Medicago truncatula TaxID=3880 RepID=A2Q3M4_MEDTR|nr:hypothetical protein MtrDRAFT_AC155886g1v2 [Medicago truncatula]
MDLLLLLPLPWGCNSKKNTTGNKTDPIQHKQISEILRGKTEMGIDLLQQRIHLILFRKQLLQQLYSNGNCF